MRSVEGTRPGKRLVFLAERASCKRVRMLVRESVMQRTFSQSGPTTGWLAEDASAGAADDDCLSMGEHGGDGKAT